MNVSLASAPARTDDYLTTGKEAPALDGPWVRRHALALVAGAVTWSAANFSYGFTPDSETGIKVTDLTGLGFQLGVLALVQVQLRTRATGLSRKAVGMLKVERVLLGLAMLWSVLHAFLPSSRDDAWLVALDMFWPLSMLGMFVIAVKIAFAGRWRGAARLYPLVAESWAVVCVPVLGIFGPAVGDPFAAGHLLVGYATLGVIIAARPHLVLPRDARGA